MAVVVRRDLDAGAADKAAGSHRACFDAGIAVIKLNRFSVRNRAEVEQALRQVADARALVLDLRGNGGGDYSQFMWLVRQFLPEPRIVLTQLSRRGDEQTVRELRMGPADTPFLKPIAVLTDRRSGSARN